MHPFKWKKIEGILAAAAVILIFPGLLLMHYNLEIAILLFIFGGALLVCIAVFNSKYWRCPSCHAMLPTRRRLGERFDYCPACGKELKDDG